MLAAVLQLNGFAAGGTVSNLAVLEAYVGKSGRTVIVVIQRLGVDTVLAAGTGDATISINGGAPITLAVKNVNQSVVYMQAEPTAGVQDFTIISTDTVTISAPSGWVTANSGADLSPAISQTLTNRVGVEHLTIVTTNGLMPVGWNLHKPSYFNPVRIYNNEVRHANRFTNTTSTYDSNGYPTSIVGTVEAIINQCNAPSGEGWEGMQSGTWRIMWDGASGNCTLTNQGANTTVVAGASSTGNAVDNFRDYTVTVNTLPGGIKYAVTAVPVSNIRIYPPGVDTTQKFRAEFLTQLDNCDCIRYLDAFDTNSSNVIDFTDFTTSDSITYFRRQNQQVSNVTSFEAWTNDGSFETANRIKILCTTSAAHGFTTGMTVDFSGATAIACNSGAFTITPTNNYLIKVISPTTFSFAHFRTGGGTVDALVSPPACTCLIDIAGTMPIADAVELCNLKNCDLWFCVPHLATDACVTSIAAYIAANLNSGLNCICEYSNELWNTATAFNQFRYAYMQGQFDATIVAATSNVYTRGDYWSAQRATQIHTLFTAAWNAAGRSTTTLSRFLGSQIGSTAQTTNRLFWAVDTLGKTIDSVGFAVYWDNNVVSANAALFTDNATVSQLLDLTAAVIEHDTTQETTRWPAQKAILNTYNLPMWCYETGAEVFAAGSTVGMEKSRAVARDPRMRYFQYLKLKQMEDAGFVKAAIYVHGGANGNTSAIGGNGNTNWQVFIAYDQVAGLGDGSDGLFDNRTSYDDHSQVVSVQGYAIHEWMGAYVTAPVVVVPTTVTVDPTTVQSELYRLCLTLPFFSATMHYDLERVKFPICSFERDQSILVQRHSCGTREEAFNVYFNTYALTFTDIFDVHEKLKQLFEFKSIIVSNRNVINQEFGREEIIEEEPGIFHGIYVLAIQLERAFSVQQNLVDITYGSSVLEAVNTRFNAHTSLIQKSTLAFNYIPELSKRPYTVISEFAKEEEWKTSTSRIDNNSFSFRTICSHYSEAEDINSEIEEIFDYCKFGLPDVFTICEWQGNNVQELEPGIWSGEVIYNVLTEKSIYG